MTDWGLRLSAMGGVERPRAMRVLILAAVVSLAAKVLLSSFGHNFDVESYEIMADAVLDGQIVYEATDRYNYGPVWAYVVAAIRFVQLHVFQDDGIGQFHKLVAILLGCADAALGFMLAAEFSLLAGVIFMLNPVSLLITGFQSQFDNVAVLIGLGASVALFGGRGRSQNRIVPAALLLGVSLMTKHVLIFFPLWLAMRKEFTLKERALLVAVPYGMFLGGFLPFAFNEAARSGIVENVFRYGPVAATGFYSFLCELFVPLPLLTRAMEWVPVMSGFKFVWFASVVAAGFAFRRCVGGHYLLMYLICMCAMTSHVAEQYYAIPMIACAVFYRSWLLWVYAAYASVVILAAQGNAGAFPALAPMASMLRHAGVRTWRPLAFLFLFPVVEFIRMRCGRRGQLPFGKRAE